MIHSTPNPEDYRMTHPEQGLPGALDAPGVAQDIARIPQADRVKLAILLVRDVEEGRCIGPLSRLAEEATAASGRILRRQFEQERG